MVQNGKTSFKTLGELISTLIILKNEQFNFLKITQIEIRNLKNPTQILTPFKLLVWTSNFKTNKIIGNNSSYIYHGTANPFDFSNLTISDFNLSNNAYQLNSDFFEYSEIIGKTYNDNAVWINIVPHGIINPLYDDIELNIHYVLADTSINEAV